MARIAQLFVALTALAVANAQYTTTVIRVSH